MGDRLRDEHTKSKQNRQVHFVRLRLLVGTYLVRSSKIQNALVVALELDVTSHLRLDRYLTLDELT